MVDPEEIAHMPPRVYTEDPEFTMSPEHLPDDVYAQAISSLVVVCADVLFADRARKTVFLAHRKVKPMVGLWLIGGRIRAGEQADAGMARLVQKETSLVLPAGRFEFLAMHRYFFKDRKQQPQEKGTDALVYTFLAEVTPDELRIAAAHLDSGEYETAGFEECNRDALVAAKVYPAILDLYDSVFPECA